MKNYFIISNMWKYFFTFDFKFLFLISKSNGVINQFQALVSTDLTVLPKRPKILWSMLLWHFEEQ